jgi:hypothetical protein
LYSWKEGELFRRTKGDRKFVTHLSFEAKEKGPFERKTDGRGEPGLPEMSTKGSRAEEQIGTLCQINNVTFKGFTIFTCASALKQGTISLYLTMQKMK